MTRCALNIFLNSLFLISWPGYLIASDVERWILKFEQAYYSGYQTQRPLKDLWFSSARSGDAARLYICSEGLDALDAAFRATRNIKYLNDAIDLAMEVLSSARNIRDIKNSRTTYRGWTVKDSTLSRRNLYGTEVPLYESYWYRYLSRFLYNLQIDSRYSSIFQREYNLLLQNLQQGWMKWEERHKPFDFIETGDLNTKYFFRSRVHMSSHWGTVALYLKKISTVETVRSQCEQFVRELTRRLANNFKRPPGDQSLWYWNATWDDTNDRPQIQDVSHGNHVVSFLVELYSFHINSKGFEVFNICSLIKNRLYIESSNRFVDSLNGARVLNSEGKGAYQSDGWVKLARFDKGVYSIYCHYAKCIDCLLYHHQSGQYFANMALNAKMLNL